MIRDGPAGWRRVLRGALPPPSSFDSVHDRVHCLACLQPGLIRPSLVSPSRFPPPFTVEEFESLCGARARRFANFSENFSAAATSEKPGRTRRRRGEPVNALATLDSLVASPFCDFDLCSRERRKEKGKRGRNCDRTVCCGRVMQMQRGQAKINLQRGGRRGTDEDGVTE